METQRTAKKCVLSAYIACLVSLLWLFTLNFYILIHLCELFEVPEAGQAHDPAIDAINLANLYGVSNFLAKKLR